MIHEPLNYRAAGVEIEPGKPLAERTKIATLGTCRNTLRTGIDGIGKRLVLARIDSVTEIYP